MLSVEGSFGRGFDSRRLHHVTQSVAGEPPAALSAFTGVEQLLSPFALSTSLTVPATFQSTG